MKPSAIPAEMLYPRGIIITVINAGIAYSNSFHLISARDEAINTPTIINAGAVTADVTTTSKGEKNNAKTKNPAVTTEVNPVLPPAETPAVDSTYDVVVEVPNVAPTIVATESADSALPILGSFPSFKSPAFFVTATKVPAVSKKSINKSVKITMSISFVKSSSKCPANCPKVGSRLGIPCTISSGSGTCLKIIPTIAVTTIP